MHSPHCTRHTAQSTLHKAHCTAHTTQATLHRAHCKPSQWQLLTCRGRARDSPEVLTATSLLFTVLYTVQHSTVYYYILQLTAASLLFTVQYTVQYTTVQCITIYYITEVLTAAWLLFTVALMEVKVRMRGSWEQRITQGKKLLSRYWLDYEKLLSYQVSNLPSYQVT